MRYIVPPTQVELPTISPIAEARISGGMNSRIDPADLPNGISTELRGARTRADYTMRAPGKTLIPGTKPDSLPILMFTEYARFDKTNIVLRFSRSRVDRYAGGSYSIVTGSLAGTNTDGIRFITTADAAQDYFIFTNNGANPIQVMNSTVTSYGNLGNAGRYRYVCAFFNRIVAANLAGPSPNPILLGWSGDFNFTEWNPINDISAGSTPLQEAQSDYADPITGLFAFASIMLILRERSLWTATKRPVASNPFAFQAAFNYLGCDCPGSATQTKSGITWYDRRTNQVYNYVVGGRPEEIGDPIKDELRSAVTSNDLVWGSYDMTNETYILTVPSTASTNSRVFFYNFSTKSWSYEDIEGAYGYYPVDGGASRLTYGQLTGTYGQLTAANANYGAIGLIAATPPKNHIGYTNGDIRSEEDVDAGSGEFCFTSKVYRNSTDDLEISRLMMLIRPIRNGSLTIEFRKNGRTAWIPWKTIPFESTLNRIRIYATKLIRANEFQWRVRSSSGQFHWLEYKLEASTSGQDKNP
ncbi:MAG: hypothetical protein LW852_06235 [Sediminibacterium sp.]|jgi:hypothetical protein|nr:hypothetical protein [Sediminibacterium sp.]